MKNSQTHKILIRVGLVCMIVGTIFLYSCGGGGSSTPAAQTPTLIWGQGNWDQANWG
jgi:hypothetical protein